MKNISIKARLIFVITFLSAFLIGVGVLGLSGMKAIDINLQGVVNDRLIPSHQIAEINHLMETNMRQLQLATMHDPRLEEHVLHDHPIGMHTNAVRQNIERITQIWERYMATELTPDEVRLADDYVRLRGIFVREGLLRGIEMLEAGRYKDANMHLITVTLPAFNEAYAVAQRLLTLQQDVAMTAFEESQALYEFDRNVVIIAITLSVLLSALMGWLLIRAIVAPLDRTIGYFNQISDGNLNNAIVITNNDEIGRVMQALEAMQAKLRGLIVQVREAVDSINTSAKEISAGNLDLSQRTEEQASSLEETASSMEELTSTVKQNAENARQANQLAQSASEGANAGGEKVRKAVETMDEMSTSSEKISNIISVIDGIAFQTNILALNAAVEAARAGEQGRGFAVVAGEVRTLAQRSAAAAKEIQQLITDNAAIVASGSTYAREAGEAMNEIVNSVKRVTDIMAEISAASEEQSQGIEQVNQAISQMDEVTQQNAALVEESAAAAESLEEQAADLAESVSMFQVDEGAHGSSKPSAAVKPAAGKAAALAHTKSASGKAGASHGKVAGKLPASTKPKPPAKPAREDDDWEEF